MGIRVAQPADVVSIRRLMQSERGSWQAHWSDATLATAIANAGDLALVNEEHGAIIGFACAHDVGFRAYLSELIVAPAVRRRGIATSLLAHIEERLAARGCTVLIADVWVDAEPFYLSLGWQTPSARLLRKRLNP